MTRKAATRACLLPVFVLSALSGGCSGAPSLVLLGAYFPAWLVCALVAVLAALAARLAMLATGLAQALPLQLFVCAAIGVIAATIVWSYWMGF